MKNKIEFVTIGADPEIFIQHNDSFVSSEEFIPGDKYLPFEFSEKGHAMQKDNVMLEFCIPPTSTVEDFQTEMKFALDYLDDYVKKENPEYSLAIIPSANFTVEQLSTKHAKTFGCDPDYNIYLEDQNPVPKGIEGVRCAGGHVHVGIKTELSIGEYAHLVKYLDLTLGVPSVIMDTDDRRKKVYGTAGRFRIKKYGLEYRTLSNYWIQNQEYIKFIYNGVQKAIEMFNNEEKIDFDMICKTIDNNDKETALQLCDKYKINILKKYEYQMA